jgi:hypothetical protein
MLDEPEDLLGRIATRPRGADSPAGVRSAWLVALLYLASFVLPVGRDAYGSA